ncbi:MAG: hypothetical protein J0L93_07965 [Deltaproteobacteria bacterium]|nr:hypothetical protein [Deltaproteobacteria bacterium]
MSNKSKIAFVLIGLCVLFFSNRSANAETDWTNNPMTITQLGAWGPWFGVTVNDPNSTAAPGCAGNSPKAIDISNPTATTQAQQALLMIAFAKQQKVLIHYGSCVGSGGNLVNVIDNVQLLPK